MLFLDMFSVSLIVLERWSLKNTRRERKLSCSLTLQTDISPLFDFFIFYFFTSGANLSWVKQHLGPSITSEWKVINDRLWMLIPYFPPPADMIIRLISRSLTQTPPPARRKYWFHFIKNFTKFWHNPADPSEGEIPVLYIPGLNPDSLSLVPVGGGRWNRQFPVWLFLLLSPSPRRGRDSCYHVSSAVGLNTVIM